MRFIRRILAWFKRGKIQEVEPLVPLKKPGFKIDGE